MSVLHIKRGEGGTLEVSSNDAVAICSRTEHHIGKEM